MQRFYYKNFKGAYKIENDSAPYGTIVTLDFRSIPGY